MKVGQLAEAAGVSVQAIRFYERRGLLPAPPRLTSGYRDYPAETVWTALLIKHMQGLGFTLRELERFIRLLESQPHNPAERRRCVQTPPLSLIYGFAQNSTSILNTHTILAVAKLRNY
jgi:DNA-binding transcriptional MerR regulator